MNRKILIVDDNPADIDIYKIYLSRISSKFEFFSATNVSSAIEKMYEVKFDCVLLDYFMPDETGIAALQKIRLEEKFLHIPIIITTGQGDEEIAVQSMKAGASDYLVKGSFDGRKLHATIENAIEKQNLYFRIEEQRREKDEFLTIVSHDLKSPLAFIHTAMDMLLSEEYLLQPNAEKLVNMSKKNAHNALELITNLLDHGRQEGEIKLEYKRFSLVEIIQEVINNLEFKAKEKNIKINLRYINDIYIKADYGRFAQVINNLLTNAIKFSYENSPIDIDFTLIDTPANSTENEGSFVKIHFRDYGPGISEFDQKIIFNKYKQVHKGKKEGSGLGLSICKKICELHGGSVWVESSEGKGCHFFVTLPRAENIEGSSSISRTLQKKKILLIDDSDAMLLLSKLTIEKLGHEVVTASDGQEGLQIVRSGHYDLVIVDLEMPIMDGKEFVANIKSDPKYCELPIILYSSQTREDLIDELSKWVNLFIQKPASAEELDSKIKQAFGELNTFKNNAPLVVFADDIEEIRNLVSLQISAMGLNIVTAKNGMEALFLVKKLKPDLIITDLKMAVMDGIELTKRIKNSGNANIPIILASSYFDADILAGVDFLRNHELIYKPFVFSDLEIAIRKALPNLSKK